MTVLYVLETLGLVSAGTLAFTFIGYPVLLSLLVERQRPSPKPPSALRAELRAVTVVIVAYNEAARIGSKLENVLGSAYPTELLRVVVGSDASTDNTAEIVRGFAGRGVRLLEFQQRRGKAACLNDAMAVVDTDLVIMMDVRQRIAGDAIRRLVDELSDPKVGAVSGELVLEQGTTGFSRGIDSYWRYEKFIRESEARIDSAVGVTGAIYAVRKSLFEPLPAGTVLDDVLVPMRVVRQGYRVGFCGGAHAFDVPSEDPRAEQRRKIRTLTGNWQLLQMEPWLISPMRNRIWWQYFSHKVLRLVAPLFLVLLLISSAVLAQSSSLFAAALIAQLAFYFLPMVGAVLRPGRIKSILVAPMAFLFLNWFAVRGFWDFIRRRELHLWR